MALLFKRKHEVKKQLQEQDAGNKLINKLLMIGLIIFIGMSVLNEKRALEKQKLVWEATAFNFPGQKSGKIRVVENEPFRITLSEEDIAKIKDLPRDADGNVEIFNMRMNQLIVKEEPKPTVKQTAKPAAQPAPVKTEKKEVKDTKQNLPAEPKPETKEAPAPEAKTNVIP